MDPERYGRIKEILVGAQQHTDAERDAFLDEACGGDAGLRREVEQFLAPDLATEAVLGGGVRLPPDEGRAPALPEMLGVYRTGAEIGRGGMGVVYAAIDTRDGSRVALKRVHAHLLSSQPTLARFAREARLGQQIAHENVVRTLGLETFDVDGVEEHVLVMEHVRGTNGRELLREYAIVPEGLVREIAVQVSSGLAAIHEAGIVHRDLKPENIIIAVSGGDEVAEPDRPLCQRVRIMDLGVARLIEATIDVTRSGHFVGSLAYASPEQFGGGTVGPAADLYSVGVLLYELATGENPFHRDHAAASMRAHVEETPVPANVCNPQVSRFLAAVLARLLAKDPAERFESAARLRHVLVAGEVGEWWTAQSGVRDAARPRLPEIPVRRETAVYGRDGELERLRTAWKRAVEGQGQVVLLEGEAGIGKTRLVHAFLSEVLETDAHLLYGSFPPTGGLGGITDAVVGKLGAGELEQALASVVETSEDLVPAVAALFRRETPPAGAPVLRRELLEAVCCQLMTALAVEKPTVWILDDLHFAPARARGIAQALARAAEPSRALVLLTTRPGISDAEREELHRTPNYSHVALGRLSPRAVQDLIREAFHSDAVADELGARIAHKSDGVPFFVFEMLHALADQRYLDRRPDGRYTQARTVTNIDVPTAVRDLIASRLKALSRAEREVVDVASVQGHGFDAELVARVLGRPLVGVLQDLAEVERQHAVVRSAGRLHRFDHHQIQEVLYDALAPRLREEYHALLGDAAEQRTRTTATTARDMVFLATHHLRGSRPESALPHLAAALDYLQRDELLEPVVTLIDLALGHEGLVSGAKRVELLLRQSFCLAILGLHDREKVVATDALELARELGDLRLESRALGRVASHGRSVADFPSAIVNRRLALEVANESGDSDLELQQMGALGGDLLYGGEREQAVELLETVCDLSFEIGDKESETNALQNLGALWATGGEPARALEALVRAREVAEETGDRYRLAQAEGNLALVYWRNHQLEKAGRHYTRGLELGRAMGARKLVALGHGGLGQVRKDQGDMAAAREHFQRQHMITRELGNRVGMTYALVNLINLSNDLGDADRAEALADEAMALIAGVTNARFAAGIILLRSETAALRGDRAAARRLAEECLEMFRGIGERTFEAEVLVALGAMAREDGDADVAEPLLRQGQEMARELPNARLIVTSAAHLALQPGASPDALLEGLAEHGAGLSLLSRVHVRFLAWQATGDRAHLEESHACLRTLIDQAPPECRESMAANVPVYRDIRAAWAAEGA